MRAVRGSRVSMAVLLCFCSSVAPLAPSGSQDSTAQTCSSGHGSTVTFRRILCSTRCFCSASSTELSHSRRKAGSWSACWGTLWEKAAAHVGAHHRTSKQSWASDPPASTITEQHSIHRRPLSHHENPPPHGHVHAKGWAQGPQWQQALKVRQKGANVHPEFRTCRLQPWSHPEVRVLGTARKGAHEF